MSPKADPLKSEGARLERKAVRAYLRRLIKNPPPTPPIETVLAWILKREARYSKRTGGL